jgi:LPS-assembly lipoprotein
MYKLIASLLIASLLCACGWHLRGSTPVSKSIYLSSEDNYSPVRLELEQLMAIHGITLAASPAESDLQLHIEEEIADRRTAAVGADALTSAYELFLTVHYQMRSPEGLPVSDQSTALVTRIFNYTAEGASSGAQEEALLLEEMRRELAQMLLRRLSAINQHLNSQTPKANQAR